MFIKLGSFKFGPSSKQIFTNFTVNLVHLVIIRQEVSSNSVNINFPKINNSERNKKNHKDLENKKQK